MTNYDVFRNNCIKRFLAGITPVDSRQPIADELAKQMVSELIDMGVDKDSKVGVIDAFMILSTHLKEAGFTNLTLIEQDHQELEDNQVKYYNMIQGICKNSDIVYSTDTADMKFDVIIGNPPYSETSSGSTNNGNLDSKFFLVSMDKAGCIKLIIRSKHFTDPRSKFRRQLFSSGHLRAIDYIDSNTFNIDSRIMTCVVTYDTNYTGLCDVTYNTGEVKSVELSKDSLVFLDSPDKQKLEDNLSNRWVRGKVNRNKIDGDSDGFLIVEVCGSGETPIISYTKNGKNTAINTYGVVTNVVNTIGTLGRVYIKPFEAAISSSVICLQCDTKDEAIELHKYLTSEEGREAVKLNKRTAVASKEMFSYIKDPLK